MSGNREPLLNTQHWIQSVGSVTTTVILVGGLLVTMTLWIEGGFNAQTAALNATIAAQTSAFNSATAAADRRIAVLEAQHQADLLAIGDLTAAAKDANAQMARLRDTVAENTTAVKLVAQQLDLSNRHVR